MATPRDLEEEIATIPTHSQSSSTASISNVEQRRVSTSNKHGAIDVEAARADCGLKGYAGLASLEEDEVYRIGWIPQRAAGIVRLRRQQRIGTLERAYTIAEQSQDAELAAEICEDLGQELFKHYKFSCLERQMNSFARPSKWFFDRYTTDARRKLEGGLGYLTDDPQYSMNLHDFDKLDLLVRRLLEFGPVRFIFRGLKFGVVHGEGLRYISYEQKTIIVMKMCFVLFAALTFFCIPVMILASGSISSMVSICIFYGAIVILACVASSLMFEPHIAMTITLGVAALLGTVIVR